MGHRGLNQLLFLKYHWGVANDWNPIKLYKIDIDYLTYITYES